MAVIARSLRLSASAVVLWTALILLTSSAWALIAGPSSFGYTSIDSAEPDGPAFKFFVNLDATGTRLTFFDADALPAQNANADDGVAINLPLTSLNNGGGFPFHGSFRTSIHMSTNGFLTFILDGFADSLSNNCPILNAAQPNDIIAVVWDDLVLRNPPDATAGGYMQTFNVCPYTDGGSVACVVFQWDNADHFGGAIVSFDAQAVLYANGNMLMLYPAGNPELGSGSTTGVENATASDSLTHVCDATASLPDKSAILFLSPIQQFGVFADGFEN